MAHEVYRFSDWVRSNEFFQGAPDNASINDLVKRIVAKSEGLRRLVMIGARWGTDEAFRTMLRAIVAITFRDMDGSGFTWVISLRLLGASLCFQWGVAASLLRADAYDRAARLMHLTIPAKFEQGLPAVTLLPFAALDTVDWKILEGLENHHTPHSDYFSKIFVNEAKDIVVGPNEADPLWDDSEFLIAAESGYQRLPAMEDKSLWFWVPPGRFVWRREGSTSINQRMDYLRGLSSTSPELKAGLFGGNLDGLNKILPHLTEFFTKIRSYYSW